MRQEERGRRGGEREESKSEKFDENAPHGKSTKEMAAEELRTQRQTRDAAGKTEPERERDRGMTAVGEWIERLAFPLKDSREEVVQEEKKRIFCR